MRTSDRCVRLYGETTVLWLGVERRYSSARLPNAPSIDCAPRRTCSSRCCVLCSSSGALCSAFCFGCARGHERSAEKYISPPAFCRCFVLGGRIDRLFHHRRGSLELGRFSRSFGREQSLLRARWIAGVLVAPVRSLCCSWFRAC